MTWRVEWLVESLITRLEQWQQQSWQSRSASLCHRILTGRNDGSKYDCTLKSKRTARRARRHRTNRSGVKAAVCGPGGVTAQPSSRSHHKVYALLETGLGKRCASPHVLVTPPP